MGIRVIQSFSVILEPTFLCQVGKALTGRMRSTPVFAGIINREDLTSLACQRAEKLDLSFA